jgi:hypothetical protein
MSGKEHNCSYGIVGRGTGIQMQQRKNYDRLQMTASKTRRTYMAGKQFNEVAETSTSTLQEMNQAGIENLVDMHYAQRLVKNGSNGSAVLTRPVESTHQMTQLLWEPSRKQQEAFAALIHVSVEISLRFFFAPLFFIRESAEKGETKS